MKMKIELKCQSCKEETQTVMENYAEESESVLSLVLEFIQLHSGHQITATSKGVI